MNNKNVLVIGASSGLGRAVSLRFAKEGANVIVSARSIHALEQLKEEIERDGGRCHVQPCDICSEDAVRQLVADTITRFGYIDVAVLGSGVQYIDQVALLDTSEVETMFQTNVVGLIRCSRYLLPHMLEKRAGQLVFISSIMGEAAFPQMVAYGASKAAITCFARGLQREVSAQGVGITLVSPGHMDTNLSARLQDRLPHWYGKSGSLNIAAVAQQIVTAVKNKRSEIVIGRQSKMLGRMIRYLPPLANNIIRKITT